jgi:hypothetical protein
MKVNFLIAGVSLIVSLTEIEVRLQRKQVAGANFTYSEFISQSLTSLVCVENTTNKEGACYDPREEFKKIRYITGCQ